MPRSLPTLFVATVVSALAAEALAQASPYPLTRAQPYRVIAPETLLEIDRGLSAEPVKNGVAKIKLPPTEGSRAPVQGGEPVNIQSAEAFHVIAETDTTLFGRFPRAIMLRVNAEGIRIIARDEVIARMPILHFKPAIENAMMGGAWKLQPIHRGDYSPPRLNTIELPLPAIQLQPAPKKK